MRAIVVEEWCEPEALSVSTFPMPGCGEEQVLIRVAAAPVSYSLSLLVAGRYQRKPARPFVPGNTVAGTVEAVGTRAGRGLVRGHRVLASIEEGGLAEFAVAHAANVYPIPDSMGFAEATALNTSYNSVLAALRWRHLLCLQPGQTLLVNGAAGGTGTAAVELGRALGATVIASASTQAKRGWALERGAHHVVDADPAGLKDAVLSANGGRGVDAVLDPVGGETFLQSIRCLAPEGRIVPLGFASGNIPQIPANLLLVKNISVCGLYMGYYKIDARERFEPDVRNIFDELGRLFEGGRIRPQVAVRFAPDRIADAFATVLDRATMGHVVVEFRR